MRNLSLEAADALWAIRKNKNPDRDPNAIYADIQEHRTNIVLVLPELKNQPALKRMYDYCMDAAVALQSNMTNHRMLEINQDIHRLRPEVDQILAELAKEQRPFIEELPV